MVKARNLRRLLLLGVFLGLAYGGLAARLVVLQVMQHEEYRNQADRKRIFLSEPDRKSVV